jgi:hypothetical protein
VVFGFSSKHTFVFPTKLNRPPQAALFSTLGNVTVPAEKFSKKLEDVPPLAVSRSRIVNDSAVPGGMVIVTSKSALSPGRKLLPAVAESELLPATSVLVRLGEATVVEAVSDSGEKSGPPGIDAYREVTVLVIVPPKAVVASSVASYSTVQVWPCGISMPLALTVVPLEVSLGGAPVVQLEKVTEPATRVRPMGKGSERRTSKAS